MGHNLIMAEPIVFIRADGPALSPRVHGAKACGLQFLMRMGLNVPPAFVISIEAAAGVSRGELDEDVDQFVSRLCDGVAEPRLAVRSGAEVSLPGAFETLLDVHPKVVTAAVLTVISSTRSLRAMAIANTLGYEKVPPTAVIVQRQVDATADRMSGAGAATSRDLLGDGTGPVGAFAWETQGDAVMAGTAPVVSLSSLAERCPDVMNRLAGDLRRLEAELGGPAEVEFAVESSTLWYLQVRRVKNDMAIDTPPLPDNVDVIGSGRPAAPGQGEGELIIDLDDALDAIDDGRRVILALDTTSPSEVAAMARSAGVFTAIGSPECHAAVVARAAGIPAVVSVRGLTIHSDHVTIGIRRVDVGDRLLVDGTTGLIASTTVST